MNWDYLQPVTIRFGKGRVKEIKEIARSLDCKRGILVAGPFFFKSGLAEKIMSWARLRKIKINPCQDT